MEGGKRSLRCARWGDLEEAKVKGLLGGRLQIKYRNGSKEIYSGIGRGDANAIRRLLEAILPAAAGETSSALAMTSLCPDCRSPLSPRVYECPQCRIAFKNEKTLMQRAWLIPGGGFFIWATPSSEYCTAWWNDRTLPWAFGFWLPWGWPIRTCRW